MEIKLSNLQFNFNPTNKDRGIYIRLTPELREAINLVAIETTNTLSDVARGLMEVGFIVYEEKKKLLKKEESSNA